MLKKYQDLSEQEQVLAEQYFLNGLIEAIVSGAIRFNDELNKEKQKKKIDKVLAKAESKQTPWFAAEMLMENKTIRAELEGMAHCDAEDASYGHLDGIVNLDKFNK